MTPAATLAEAARLVRVFGHNPADGTGSPLSGYSLLGAIDTAADPDPARPPTIGRAARLTGAVAYLADVLGYDPDRLGTSAARCVIDRAGWPMDGPLGRLWAAAVLDQAANRAAASCLRAPTPPPLPVVSARDRSRWINRRRTPQREAA